MILALDDQVFWPGSYWWETVPPARIGDECLARLPERFGDMRRYAVVMRLPDGYLVRYA